MCQEEVLGLKEELNMKKHQLLNEGEELAVQKQKLDYQEEKLLMRQEQIFNQEDKIDRLLIKISLLERQNGSLKSINYMLIAIFICVIIGHMMMLIQNKY